MKVALGPLAKSGLETRVGPDLPAAINAALVYYVGKLSSGRGPSKYPRFLAVQREQGTEAEPPAEGAAEGSPAAKSRAEVEVQVDERIEAALFCDARRQEVSPSEIAGHAVLVYLAELDLIGDPERALLEPAHAMAGSPRGSGGTSN